MKTSNRGLRRHLTERYRSKQKRFRQIFMRDLHGLSPSITGRWTQVSWRCCGQPNCNMCTSGTRRDQWASNDEKLTMQERRMKITTHEFLEGVDNIDDIV